MFIPLLALLVVQVNFGILPIAQKLALTSLSPPALFALRSIAAALIFRLAYLLTRKKTDGELGSAPVSPRVYLQLSFLGISLNQYLLILALTMTSAVATVIVVPSITLFTYLFAVLLKKESFSLPKSMILLLGGAGVIILFGDSLFHLVQGLDRSAFFGNLLCLISAAVYAYYLVRSRDFIGRQSALEFTSRMFSWALVWTTLLLLVSAIILTFTHPEAPLSSLFFHEFRPINANLAHTPDRTQLLIVLSFIVLGPTSLNYFLNLWSLKYLPASTVSGFISLQTLIGAGLSHLILGEEIKPSYGLAAACILVSVALLSLNSFGRKRHSLASAAS